MPYPRPIQPGLLLGISNFVRRSLYRRKVIYAYSDCAEINDSFLDFCQEHLLLTTFLLFMVKISALSPLEVAKNHPRGFCRFLLKESFSQIVSATSNGDCSAQDRPRELKLVSLEPPGNFDSEFVFKISLACL
jgi:hypothetical protein